MTAAESALLWAAALYAVLPAVPDLFCCPLFFLSGSGCILQIFTAAISLKQYNQQPKSEKEFEKLFEF